jgi:lysophospholipase L1-like esterase
MERDGGKWSFENLCLWVGNIGWALFFLVLLLGALEITVRVFHAPPPERRVYDPFCHKIPRPNLAEKFKVTNDRDEWIRIQLNERGMRGPSLQALPEDGLVLVFLGGSTTENYRFNKEDTFPFQAGRHLEQSLGVPVSVLNAGMSGATAGHSLSRLQHQVLDLHPDLVVVCHAVNDLISGFHPRFRTDGRHLGMPRGGGGPASYLLSWLRGRNRGRDYTSDEPYGLLTEPETPAGERRVTDYSDFPAMAVFSRNLRSMAAIAADRAIPMLFMTQGSMYGAAVPEPEKRKRLIMTQRLLELKVIPPDIESLALGMEAFNRRILSMQPGPCVHTFDAASRIPRTWSFFYDDCHMTKKGNRLLAEILSPVMETILNATASE